MPVINCVRGDCYRSAILTDEQIADVRRLAGPAGVNGEFQLIVPIGPWRFFMLDGDVVEGVCHVHMASLPPLIGIAQPTGSA